MELKGLKAVFLGDSITEGWGTTGEEHFYWKVLGANTGLITKGYGIGGTRIARQTGSVSPRHDLDYCLRMVEMDKDADIVCVFGGTNDYGHGTAPIGKEDDQTPETFYGALNYMFKCLLSTYPKSFVFVMTPLHRAVEKQIKTLSNGETREFTLLEYTEIIRKMAEKYSVPVLDLYKEAGINPQIEEQKAIYMKDGLHPTDEGAAKIAGVIEEFLKTKYYKK